jgi:hypothetical protein
MFTSAYAAPAIWPAGKALERLAVTSKVFTFNEVQQDGIAVARMNVKNCYAHLKRIDWGAAQAHCVTLDVAAYVYEFHQPSNYQALDNQDDPYLSGPEFNKRMMKYLPPPNGSIADKEQYLTQIVLLMHKA